MPNTAQKKKFCGEWCRWGGVWEGDSKTLSKIGEFQGGESTARVSSGDFSFSLKPFFSKNRTNLCAFFYLKSSSRRRMLFGVDHKERQFWLVIEFAQNFYECLTDSR